MITLDNICFSYRKGVFALKGASAEIGSGIHLMLGPNGAGKTTLLKVMCGLLQPQQGECLIDGEVVGARMPSVLDKVFYLDDNCLFPLSTINEMASRHAPFYPTFSPEQLAANLEAFGLTGEEKFSDMSLGARKKANVSYALALGTEVLLLDEPANGMDISSKKVLNKVIASSMREGQTIIIATHTVHDMRNLFDGVVLIDHGRVAMCMLADEITARYAFVLSPQPLEGALYTESGIEGHHCMILNEDGIETPIDYELLYGAMANGAIIKSEQL